MVSNLTITVLADNNAGGRGLLAEHGWACLVEADGHRILFDTGQGLALAHNAEVLNIDLADVSSLVLSHGHWDHTGGLKASMPCLSDCKVFVHPNAFEPKYARYANGNVRSVAAPLTVEDLVSPHVNSVVKTAEPTSIANGVWATGQIPRCNEFEDTGGPFYLDVECSVPDTLVDDQAIFVETSHGIVVILGCAHSGVINTLDYIEKLSDSKPIHALIGGMHLGRASTQRMDRTIDSLRHYGVQIIGPAHCTGSQAIARIISEFPERFLDVQTGTHVVFR